ncbi:hypothetical protein DMC15_10600 [Vibrio sp. 11986-1-5]|nr:hypothetical protein DMC15_10600 [Vibrio sp. 11986-1-5]
MELWPTNSVEWPLNIQFEILGIIFGRSFLQVAEFFLDKFVNQITFFLFFPPWDHWLSPPHNSHKLSNQPFH